MVPTALDDRMDQSATIRIGLVGCGRIGLRHVEAVEALGGCARIAAVCDVDPGRAATAAVRTGGASCFTDLRAMLAAGGLDAVAVCTPSGLHPTHGCLAAAAGCHVLCEKPPGLDLASIDAMLQACDNAGTRCFVVLQNRLNPPVVALKRALDERRLGRVCLIHASVLWCRPQAYFDEAAWRGTRDLDGGVLMNQACHYLDLLQWLVGDVSEVAAFGATRARQIAAEDTAVVAVRFACGAVGSLSATVAVQPRNFEGGITVIGSSGTVRIGGVALDRVEHWGLLDVQDGDPVPTGMVAPNVDVYGTGHVGWYQAVVEALTTGQTTPFEGPEVRRVAVLLQAVRDALQRSEPVSLGRVPTSVEVPG